MARLEGRLAQLAEQMASTNRSVDEGAKNTVVQVAERLARLEEAAKRIEQVGGGLRDVLQAPKLRGGLGELLLESLLAQSLPKDRFSRQYTLRNGMIVDAAVHLPGGLLSIDAKFPLEAYQRSVQSETDTERGTAHREFVRSVRSRISEIAERYIVPAETMDFALMYVPAEAVYYALISEENLMALARDQQVVPVSPNTLWLYMQSILVGLRGLELHEDARRIHADLALIHRGQEAFQSDFAVLGRHLRNAATKYDEATRGLDRLGQHIERAASVPGLESSENEGVPGLEERPADS